MFAILTSALLTARASASNVHTPNDWRNQRGAYGDWTVAASDGGASISFPSGHAPPPGLSISSVPSSHGAPGFCGSLRPSSSAIQTTQQARLNKIFKGNSPLPGTLMVQLQGTDQQEAMDEMGMHVCSCGGGVMLYDRMTLQHIEEGSFETSLTWKGSNDQDYIHIIVRNGVIISTTVSLCPDNEGMTRPTVVEYDHARRCWIYKGMKGSMEGAVGTYEQHGETRSVGAGGLVIYQGQKDITNSFIPTQESLGHTLGGACETPILINSEYPGMLAVAASPELSPRSKMRAARLAALDKRS